MEKFPILYVYDEEHNLISFAATFRRITRSILRPMEMMHWKSCGTMM
jgi:hypothetical protein